MCKQSMVDMIRQLINIAKADRQDGPGDTAMLQYLLEMAEAEAIHVAAKRAS